MGSAAPNTTSGMRAEQRGARAHRARLERDDERAVVEAPAVARARGVGDREQLGVRGRVAVELAFVVPARERPRRRCDARSTAPTGTSSCASAARASSSASAHHRVVLVHGSRYVSSTKSLAFSGDCEQVLEHLAARVVRQLVAELDRARHLEPGQRRRHPLLHVGLGERARCVRHHERRDLLAELRVVDADDRDLGDLGVLEQPVLDLDR